MSQTAIRKDDRTPFDPALTPGHTAPGSLDANPLPNYIPAALLVRPSRAGVALDTARERVGRLVR